MLGVDSPLVGLALMVLAATFFIVAAIAGTAWALPLARKTGAARLDEERSDPRHLDEAQRSGERATEGRPPQDQVPSKYLKQLSPYLEAQGWSPSADRPADAAQSYTLNLLDKASPKQKRRIVQLLNDCGLIGHRAQGGVSLNDADLSAAELDNMRLEGTNFDGANLSGADLAGSVFSEIGGTGEDYIRAVEEGLTDDAYSKPNRISSLCADLSGASLKGAELMGCWLSANFEGADLEHADLRGAKMLFARNLTQEQINRAYGGDRQPGSAQNTILPPHLAAPEFWSKPIHEQMRELENSSGPASTDTDDELKSRCAELAEELTAFLDRWENYRDRGEKIFPEEPGEWPRYTMGEYRRHEFDGKLATLLDDLERHGRLTAEQRAHFRVPTDDPQTIREVVARLSTISFA
jgi:hypothetical protein